MTLENTPETEYISLGVQFSGKTTVYNYFIPKKYACDADWKVQPGTRVVVPNSLKDDNTLSLTIATVVEVHDEKKEDATKPVVQVISPSWLKWATEYMADLAKASA
jgi:hypothetical protein